VARGIDTNRERNSVEYRPNLEYIPKEVYVENEYEERTTYEVPEELNLVSDIKVTDTYELVDDNLKKVNKLINELESEVKDYTSTIDDESVDFSRYKELKLKDTHTAGEIDIIDQFEDDHRSIEEDIKLEILDMAYDLKDEILTSLGFVKSDLLEVPDNFDLAKQREKEIKLLNEWLETDIKKKELEKEYKEMKNPTETELNTWRREYQEVNDKLDKLSAYGPKGRIGRALYDRATKTAEVLDKWESLKNNTVADMFDGYLGCVVNNFLSNNKIGFNTISIIKRLKKVQALLEFAHGSLNGDFLDLKKQIKSIKSLPQRFAMEAGAAAIGVFTKRIGRSVAEFIRYSTTDSGCKPFEEIGQELIDVTRALDIEYQELLDDYYRTNNIEYSHYKDINSKLEDKKRKQGLFKLLDMLISSLSTLEKSVRERPLDEWVDDFLENNNLNTTYNKETNQIERI